MEKVKDYMVVMGHSHYGLGDKVVDLIEQGWQPHGNAMVDPNFNWYQPIVKYEEGGKNEND